MADYDLVVRGGRVVTPSGVVERDVCISDGRIAALSPHDSSRNFSRSIDASGNLVFPGLIDSHVHFRDPGMTHKEDFATGTKGAAAGGVTLVFDMPTTLPVVTNSKLFDEKVQVVKDKAHVDYALLGAAGPTNLGELEGLARSHSIAFKTYTVSPPKERVREYEGSYVTNPGDLLKVMEEVGKTGLVHCIHAEEDSTVGCLTEKMVTEGRKDPLAHYDSRPNFTEAQAVFDAIVLSEATGARIHIVHVSTSEAVELIRDAKKRKVKVTAETCPHYLYFSKEILERDGPYAKYNPPARNKEDTEALLSAVRDGTIDMIVTDHAPHTKEEKERGRDDIFKAPPGTPGVETRLPLLLKMVDRGLLSLEEIPRITSESVARAFGLFPRKGAVEAGSDADLAIVDYGQEWVLKSSDLQTKAWETVIYNGMHVRGRVKCTLVRGEVVYEEGSGFESSPRGRFVSSAENA